MSPLLLLPFFTFPLAGALRRSAERVDFAPSVTSLVAAQGAWRSQWPSAHSSSVAIVRDSRTLALFDSETRGVRVATASVRAVGVADDALKRRRVALMAFLAEAPRSAQDFFPALDHIANAIEFGSTTLGAGDLLVGPHFGGCALAVAPFPVPEPDEMLDALQFGESLRDMHDALEIERPSATANIAYAQPLITALSSLSPGGNHSVGAALLNSGAAVLLDAANFGVSAMTAEWSSHIRKLPREQREFLIAATPALLNGVFVGVATEAVHLTARISHSRVNWRGWPLVRSEDGADRVSPDVRGMVAPFASVGLHDCVFLGGGHLTDHGQQRARSEGGDLAALQLSARHPDVKIRLGGVNVIYGPSGVGKTTFAAAIARAGAVGRPDARVHLLSLQEPRSGRLAARGLEVATGLAADELLLPSLSVAALSAVIEELAKVDRLRGVPHSFFIVDSITDLVRYGDQEGDGPGGRTILGARGVNSAGRDPLLELSWLAPGEATVLALVNAPDEDPFWDLVHGASLVAFRLSGGSDAAETPRRLTGYRDRVANLLIDPGMLTAEVVGRINAGAAALLSRAGDGVISQVNNVAGDSSWLHQP